MDNRSRRIEIAHRLRKLNRTLFDGYGNPKLDVDKEQEVYRHYHDLKKELDALRDSEYSRIRVIKHAQDLDEEENQCVRSTRMRIGLAAICTLVWLAYALLMLV